MKGGKTLKEKPFEVNGKTKSVRFPSPRGGNGRQPQCICNCGNKVCDAGYKCCAKIVNQVWYFQCVLLNQNCP